MSEPNYYYAEDEKVSITPDEERVVVDFSRLHDASTKLGAWMEVRKDYPPLRGELRLLDRSELPDEIYAELDEKAALHPVYRYDDSFFVVLPEVRVEGSRAQQARIRTLIEKNLVRAAVEHRGEGRLILRPLSGKGADAIALANTVHEKIHPLMAQARFLRVVPRPALVTR